MRVAGWLFRSRKTGRIAIAQRPNLSLCGFAAAALVRLIPQLNVGTREVAGDIAVGFLTWWSLDEVLRGVNPWRRILGVVTGALVVVALARRFT